ncbi:MAG: hypothetical protein ACK559_23605, partial [bacterium]
VLEQAHLVDQEVGERCQPIGFCIAQGQLESTQGDFARAGGLITGDDVVHIMADVIARIGGGAARQSDAVAAIELREAPAQAAAGMTAQGGHRLEEVVVVAELP